MKVVEWVVALLVAVAAAFNRADPSKWDEPYQAHIRFLVDWSITLLVTFAFITFGLKVLREIVDQKTVNKRDIKKTLDALQKEFFQGTAPEDLYKNRVTLFKARTKLFTRKRFLKMYARSGTSYQKVKVEFALDDGEFQNNEGVAGRAYFQNSMLGPYVLPEWPNPENPNDEACKKYCKDSGISWGIAKQLNVKSRCIAAVVVRSKEGERWGVLVLDSRDPDGINLSSPKKAMVNLVGQILTNQV